MAAGQHRGEARAGLGPAIVRRRAVREGDDEGTVVPRDGQAPRGGESGVQLGEVGTFAKASFGGLLVVRQRARVRPLEGGVAVAPDEQGEGAGGAAPEEEDEGRARPGLAKPREELLNEAAPRADVRAALADPGRRGGVEHQDALGGPGTQVAGLLALWTLGTKAGTFERAEDPLEGFGDGRPRATEKPRPWASPGASGMVSWPRMTAAAPAGPA